MALGKVGDVLIVRATKKLAQRLGGFDDVPAEPDLSLLGEWYATVIFWRPQVALFVSETTLLPVFVPACTGVVRDPQPPCRAR